MTIFMRHLGVNYILKLLKSRALFAVSLKFLCATLGMGVNWFLVKSFGSEEVSFYYLGLSYVAIARPILEFGLSNTLIKLNSINYYKGKKENIINNMNAGLFISLMIFLMLFFVYKMIPESAINIKLFSVVNYLLPSFFFITLTAIVAFNLQAIGRTISSSLLNETLYQLAFLLMLIVCFNNFSSIVDVCKLSLIISIVVFFISYFYFLMVNRVVINKLNFNVKVVFDVVHQAKPVMLLGVVSAISNNISQLIIGEFFIGKDLTAYAVSLKVSIIISFILITMSKIASPAISRFYNESALKKMEAYITKITLVTMLSSLAIGIPLMFFSGKVLAFFDYDLIEYSLVLQGLILSQIINSFFGPVGATLIMCDKANISRNIICFVFFINVFSALIFIPTFGIYSAVFINIFSTVVSVCLSYLYMVRCVGINPLLKFFSRK